MAENKKSFLLYADLIYTVKKMPLDKAGELFLTILKYVNDENPVIEDVLIDLVFEPIKQQLRRDLKCWEGIKVEKSNGGRLGNLKRWNKDLFQEVISGKIVIEEAEKIAYSRYATKLIASNRTPIKKIASVAVNVNDNVNVNVIPIGAEFPKKQIEDMVVKEMMKTWRSHNPSYFEEPELDFSACLEIAYKIAKMKKWEKQEVLNGKMQETLMAWGKIVVFVKYDPFLKKLSLSNLNSQWQNVVQKMSNTDNAGDKKANHDKELMKKLGL